jgi:hypothetical protein
MPLLPLTTTVGPACAVPVRVAAVPVQRPAADAPPQPDVLAAPYAAERRSPAPPAATATRSRGSARTSRPWTG